MPFLSIDGRNQDKAHASRKCSTGFRSRDGTTTCRMGVAAMCKQGGVGILFVYTIPSLYTLASIMRTNIVIDDALMKSALKATGLKTKKEAVELGLQTLVQLSRQADIRKLRGKLKWEGDLRESRSMER